MTGLDAYFMPENDPGYALYTGKFMAAEIGAFGIEWAYGKSRRDRIRGARALSPSVGRGLYGPSYGPRTVEQSQALRRRASLRNRDALRTAAAGKKFWHRVGWVGLGAFLIDTGAQLTRPGLREVKQREQRWLETEMYKDSQRAYTQRQRALNAIHQSQSSLRPVIGNESQYLHS